MNGDISWRKKTTLFNLGVSEKTTKYSYTMEKYHRDIIDCIIYIFLTNILLDMALPENLVYLPNSHFHGRK
jgi:hypothetical protein